MKKKYFLGFILLLCVFMLTGCFSKTQSSGNKVITGKRTMTCTKEEIDDDGYKSNETIVVTYNSTKVLKASATNITETDPEYIELQLNFGNEFAKKINSVDGMEMKYEKFEDNKIKATWEIDYERIDPEQLKEELGDWLDEGSEELYSSKNMTIEEFKEENMEGYTCK